MLWFLQTIRLMGAALAQCSETFCQPWQSLICETLGDMP
jgi:hypothetical protein